MNGRMSPAFPILPTTPTFTRRRGFLSSPGRASPSAWHGPVRPRATARTGCARASAGGLSGYSAACFLFRFPHAPPDHAILFPPGTGAHCHHGGVGRDLSDHSRRPAPFRPPVFRRAPLRDGGTDDGPGVSSRTGGTDLARADGRCARRHIHRWRLWSADLGTADHLRQPVCLHHGAVRSDRAPAAVGRPATPTPPDELAGHRLRLCRPDSAGRSTGWRPFPEHRRTGNAGQRRGHCCGDHSHRPVCRLGGQPAGHRRAAAGGRGALAAVGAGRGRTGTRLFLGAHRQRPGAGRCQRRHPADHELGAEVGLSHACHRHLRRRAGLGRRIRATGGRSPPCHGPAGRCADRGRGHHQ